MWLAVKQTGPTAAQLLAQKLAENFQGNFRIRWKSMLRCIIFKACVRRGYRVDSLWILWLPLTIQRYACGG